jgi:hypothetical protein
MYKSYGKDSAWAYKVDKYMKLIKKGWQWSIFFSFQLIV